MPGLVDAYNHLQGGYLENPVQKIMDSWSSICWSPTISLTTKVGEHNFVSLKVDAKNCQQNTSVSFKHAPHFTVFI